MRKISIILATLALLAILCLPAAAQVVIDSNVTLLVDQREPGPICKAAADLARDLEAVFGHAVRVVDKPEEASGTVIAVAYKHHLPAVVPQPTGWEVLRIQAVADPWPGKPVRQAVVLTGSDVRGVIYAVYEFSGRFLNVDPLYWWTDNPPARRQQRRRAGRLRRAAAVADFSLSRLVYERRRPADRMAARHGRQDGHLAENVGPHL